LRAFDALLDAAEQKFFVVRHKKAPSKDDALGVARVDGRGALTAVPYEKRDARIHGLDAATARHTTLLASG
jgi:hypothetical protein